MVPLFLPLVEPMGLSLVWFGIITVVGAEIGLLTPPLGISCFVIKATLDDDRIKLKDVFLGALPFAFIMLTDPLSGTQPRNSELDEDRVGSGFMPGRQSGPALPLAPETRRFRTVDSAFLPLTGRTLDDDKSGNSAMRARREPCSVSCHRMHGVGAGDRPMLTPPSPRSACSPVRILLRHHQATLRGEAGHPRCHGSHPKLKDVPCAPAAGTRIPRALPFRHVTVCSRSRRRSSRPGSRRAWTCSDGGHDRRGVG